MTNRAPVMEWYQCDDDDAWRAVVTSPFVRAQEQSARVAAVRRFWRRWRASVAGSFVLAVVLAGGWRLHQARQVMASVENDVRAAVEADAWVRQQARETANISTSQPGALAQPQAVLAAGIPPAGAVLDAARGPGLEPGRVEIAGDYAMVEVLMTESDQQWLPAPYRQTIFYQETVQGWQPTEPAEIFWQPQDALTAGRFTIVYGRRDFDAVSFAVGQIEAMDVELRAELGLPPTGQPLTIKVVTAGLPRLDPTVLAHWSDGSVLYAPSPSLLPLPVHISEGEALVQLLAGLLAQRALDDALADSLQACQWRGLADGIQRWLLWQRSELPSQDRTNGAQFLQDYQARYGGARPVRFGPNHYACATDPYARQLRTNYMADSMATAFVEYTVIAYGREHLPALLDGMRRYATWDGLIQGVYGVSAAEFEARWREFLQKDEG